MLQSDSSTFELPAGSARFRILLLRLRELGYAEREHCTVPEVLIFPLSILVVQSLT